VSQLLTESVLLSLLRNPGLRFFSALKILLRSCPPAAAAHEISINSPVVFALAPPLSLADFRLVPALQADRLDLTHMLKQEGAARPVPGASATRAFWW